MKAASAVFAGMLVLGSGMAVANACLSDTPTEQTELVGSSSQSDASLLQQGDEIEDHEGDDINDDNDADEIDDHDADEVGDDKGAEIDDDQGDHAGQGEIGRAHV